MEALIVAGSAIAGFACLLLLSKRPLADADTIAAIFMLLLALPMLEKLLLARTIAIPYAGFSLFSGAPLAFGPLLYLYARSVMTTGPSQGPRRLLHFLPFLASVVILLAMGLGRPAAPPDGSPADPSSDPGSRAIDMLIIGSLMAYTAKIVAMLMVHARGIQDYFSRTSIAINLRWLGGITLGFFLAYATTVLGELAFPVWGGNQVPEVAVLRDAATLFFAVIFGFCAIKQPVLFKAPPSGSAEGALPGNEEAPAKKYEKSGLRQDEAAILLARLEEHMSTAKPWLDADLTIEDLALALGFQRHRLTQVINDGLGKNFYRYVNEYRVEEVKRKIAVGEAERLSILGVALDSGFNSKSAFNEAFKGIMGCTPSEYRKSLRA